MEIQCILWEKLSQSAIPSYVSSGFAALTIDLDRLQDISQDFFLSLKFAAQSSIEDHSPPTNAPVMEYTLDYSQDKVAVQANKNVPSVP